MVPCKITSFELNSIVKTLALTNGSPRKEYCDSHYCNCHRMLLRTLCSAVPLQACPARKSCPTLLGCSLFQKPPFQPEFCFYNCLCCPLARFFKGLGMYLLTLYSQWQNIAWPAVNTQYVFERMAERIAGWMDE